MNRREVTATNTIELVRIFDNKASFIKLGDMCDNVRRVPLDNGVLETTDHGPKNNRHDATKVCDV